MKRLWAPWRMVYVGSADRVRECIFCTAPRMRDEEALIIFRARYSYILMNKYPYNTGHVMVAPYRHVASLADLSREELGEIGLLVQASLKGLEESLGPDGFNVGVNIGKAAGAGFADHIHVHIVPRWIGDTNFMPVIGDTRVIPQALQDTYREIRDPIARHAERILGSH